MKVGKVAIVGVGGWGKNHVRVFKEIEARGLIDGVVAVDIDRERLEGIRRRFGVEVEERLEDALRREDVDVFVISSPTPLHYEHARAAVEAGRHVLVEKPLTSTLEEALKLYELVESSGVTATVGFLLRYHPAVEELIKRISEGKLGKPLTIRGKRTSWWPLRKLDVGVVKDLAIHDIDLAHQILGVTAARVYGRVGSIVHEYEDYAVIIAEYSSGATGCFEANWLTPYKTRLLEVTGEHGIAIVDFVDDSLTFHFEGESLSPRLKPAEPLLRQDEDFIRAIEEGRSPRVTLIDGIRALAVCEAALEASRRGSIMEVEPPV